MILNPVTPTKDKVLTAVLFYKNLSFYQIRQKTRKREYCYPRQLCMYFLVRSAHMKKVDICELFDMHHTSVIHAIYQIDDLLAVDSQVQYDVAEITKLIEA